MNADGCSEAQLRIGARKGGREGHEWSSCAETAHDDQGKISRKLRMHQRGWDGHNKHVGSQTALNEV